MATTLVLCPIEQVRMSGPTSPLANTPKVGRYAAIYGMQTETGPIQGLRKSWCLARVTTWRDLAAAQADPDLFLLPTDLTAKVGIRRTALQNFVTVKLGESLTIATQDTFLSVCQALWAVLVPKSVAIFDQYRA